jgi:hypothetical protein
MTVESEDRPEGVCIDEADLRRIVGNVLKIPLPDVASIQCRQERLGIRIVCEVTPRGWTCCARPTRSPARS